jgi:hypothetical protein
MNTLHGIQWDFGFFGTLSAAAIQGFRTSVQNCGFLPSTLEWIGAFVVATHIFIVTIAVLGITTGLWKVTSRIR